MQKKHQHFQEVILNFSNIFLVKYPQAAIDNNTKGVVTIHFVIEINDKVNEVKIETDIGDGCGRRYNHLEFNYP